MHLKYKNYFFALVYAIFTLVVIISAGCDAIIPEDFEETKYVSAGIDVSASNILSRDTTGLADNPQSFYRVSARSMLSLVDEATGELLQLDSITEDEIIRTQFQALMDSLTQSVSSTEPQYTLRRDSLMLVLTDGGATTSYASLNVSAGESKDIYVYTSLVYNQNNISEYVGIELIRSDGSVVSSSNDMPMETVSSGTQQVDVPGGVRLVPTIKGRYSVQPQEGEYLVRFTKSNVAAVGQIFKILILSK